MARELRPLVGYRRTVCTLRVLVGFRCTGHVLRARTINLGPVLSLCPATPSSVAITTDDSKAIISPPAGTAPEHAPTRGLHPRPSIPKGRGLERHVPELFLG